MELLRAWGLEDEILAGANLVELHECERHDVDAPHRLHPVGVRHLHPEAVAQQEREHAGENRVGRKMPASHHPEHGHHGAECAR